MFLNRPHPNPLPLAGEGIANFKCASYEIKFLLTPSFVVQFSKLPHIQISKLIPCAKGKEWL